MILVRTESLGILFGIGCLVSTAFGLTKAEAPLVSLNVRPSYSSPADVTLDVALINSQAGCRPLVIDGTLTPLKVHSRTATVVEFEITDVESGKTFTRTPAAIDLPAPSASDFLYLDCGRFYGGRISLASPGWRYPLQRGRYTIRAKISSGARAYLAEHPDLARRLGRKLGITNDQLLDSLPPGESWSSAVHTFTIENP